MPILDKIPENSTGLFMTLNVPFTDCVCTIGFVTETASACRSDNNDFHFLEVIPNVVLSIESNPPSRSTSQTCLADYTDDHIDHDLPSFVEEINAAIDNGVSPQPCSQGVCGSYFLLNSAGERRGIFKPCDEEPGAINNLKEEGDSAGRIGIVPGEAAIREVVAFELDNGFAGVPQTGLVEIDDTNSFFNNSNAPFKTGSLQEYVNHDCSSEDIGSSVFAVHEVQRIATMDIRLVNLDRHAGNLLVKDNHLIPIDHGFCLPECFEDSLWYEWMNWSQSSKPILPDIKNYILSLNDDYDCQLLENYAFSVNARRSLRVGTYLLKSAVKLNLSLHQVASLLCTYGEESSKIKVLFDNCAKDLCELKTDSLPESVLTGLDQLLASL